MSQIILIEKNEDLNKHYAQNLSSALGSEVIVRTNVEDALWLLSILPDVDLVIVNAKDGQEETAKKIHSHIREEALQTSMIVLGSCPEISDEVICLAEPINWESLLEAVAFQLSMELRGDFSQKEITNYHSVPLIFFQNIQESPCDVYIKIRRGPDEDSFIKRIHANDVFDVSVIKKYQGQGLKEFFVLKDNFQLFNNFVTNCLVQKLERDDLSIEERIVTTANAYEIVRHKVAELEISEACLQLVNASINSMIKSVKNSPVVAQLVKFLLSNSVAYAYQHCHLVTLVAHYILSKQKEYNQKNLEALCFAAFFSDITLKTAKEMQVATMKDLSKSDFSADEIDLLYHHAQKSLEIFSQFSQDEKVKRIIIESHGSKTGVGLADNPPEDLHPLSKIFLIADSFVKILLNSNMPSTKREILPILCFRFTHHSYHKIILALESKFQ